MKQVVAGNWKMNVTATEAEAFAAAFEPQGLGAELLLFPTALAFGALARAVAGRGIEVGVQNIHWESSGAFTGEISAEQAAAAGASHALIGHSERRHLFGETDEEVGRKVSAALRAGLTPVVCVGETLDERKAGRVDEVITRQIDAVLGMVSAETRWRIAYEPVWAIGTGETATPDDATAAHRTLRTRLVERLGGGAAQAVPILYGGSVKPGNAAELLAAPEVDGVLVGGASLDPASFRAIAEAAG